VHYRQLADLDPEDAALLRAAREVAPMAFNPVSRFQVGAAVRDAGGRVFIGTNFESAALPLGVCAEPAALLAAIAAGSRDLTAIAVVGGPADADANADANAGADADAAASAGAGPPITPCGGCRQRIYDATGGAAVNIRVICSNLALDSVLDLRITDLLPYAFDAAVLPASAWRA
jgi:cytidine deaminase